MRKLLLRNTSHIQFVKIPEMKSELFDIRTGKSPTVRCITFSNCLCSSSPSFPWFSASRIRNLGIVKRYSWFWKSSNMTDRGGEFSFFWGINVRIDIRIDISISIRPMATTFSKQVHLDELTQIRLIKQMLVTLPECLRPPNLSGWEFTLIGSCT